MGLPLPLYINISKICKQQFLLIKFEFQLLCKHLFKVFHAHVQILYFLFTPICTVRQWPIGKVTVYGHFFSTNGLIFCLLSRAVTFGHYNQHLPWTDCSHVVVIIRFLEQAVPSLDFHRDVFVDEGNYTHILLILLFKRQHVFILQTIRLPFSAWWQPVVESPSELVKMYHRLQFAGDKGAGKETGWCKSCPHSDIPVGIGVIQGPTPFSSAPNSDWASSGLQMAVFFQKPRCYMFTLWPSLKVCRTSPHIWPVYLGYVA